MTMTPAEVITEMRETAAEIARAGIAGFGNRCTCWAEALEQAMQEPVGEVVDTPYGPGWTVFDLDIPVGTKLYPLPPDAQAEIERLKERINGLMFDHIEAALAAKGAKP